jgi:hypothetical protein
MRTSLRHAISLAAGTAVLVLGSSLASAQNLFSNASFEDPITTDGPPFVGSWEGFSGGSAFSVNGGQQPRTGTLHARFGIDNFPNAFAGAFQDVTGLTPGTPVAFSVYHMTPSSPLNVGTEVRIEWRNSVSNTEVSRTPNSTPVPGASYTLFNLDAVVPAGADTARAVYAIQSFSTAPLGNGEVYVDDASFVVVPEPASMALLSAAGLVVARRRRV